MFRPHAATRWSRSTGRLWLVALLLPLSVGCALPSGSREDEPRDLADFLRQRRDGGVETGTGAPPGVTQTNSPDELPQAKVTKHKIDARELRRRRQEQIDPFQRDHIYRYDPKETRREMMAEQRRRAQRMLNDYEPDIDLSRPDMHDVHRRQGELAARMAEARAALEEARRQAGEGVHFNPQEQQAPGGSLRAWAKQQGHIDDTSSKRSDWREIDRTEELSPDVQRARRDLAEALREQEQAMLGLPTPERTLRERKQATLDRESGVLRLLNHPWARLRVEGAYAASALSLQVAREPMEEMVRNEDVVAPQVALGLAGLGLDGDTAEVLIEALDSDIPMLRLAAVRTLGLLRVRRARGSLLAILGERPLSWRRLPGEHVDAEGVPTGKAAQHVGVRVAAARALGQLGDTRVVEPLHRHMTRREEVDTVRVACAESLARLGDERGWEFLSDGAHGMINMAGASQTLLDVPRYSPMQLLCVQALGHLHVPAAVNPLVAALQSVRDEIWMAAVQQLIHFDPRMTHPTLRRLERVPNQRIREQVMLVLACSGAHDADRLARQLLGSPRPRLRASAARILGVLGDREATPRLIAQLEDPHRQVRLAAMEALGRLRDPQAVHALERMAADSDDEIRAVAVTALAWINDNRELFRRSPGDVKKHADETREQYIRRYRVETVIAMPSGKGEAAVVLTSPTGERRLFRAGDEVAEGFRVERIAPGNEEAGKAPSVVVVHNKLGLSVTLR